MEGLAVYVSGQLETGHRTAAAKALAAGKGPKSLAKAWSGPHRYGVCGSMVRYLDETHGRKLLGALLADVKHQEALKRLGVTEPEFLEAWSAWVKKMPAE